MTYHGKGRVCLGEQEQKETIQTNYKMNFTKTVVKDFTYTLRVTFTDFLKYFALHKNAYF